jgi:hypothetical protein
LRRVVEATYALPASSNVTEVGSGTLRSPDHLDGFTSAPMLAAAESDAARRRKRRGGLIGGIIS